MSIRDTSAQDRPIHTSSPAPRALPSHRRQWLYGGAGVTAPRDRSLLDPPDTPDETTAASPQRASSVAGDDTPRVRSVKEFRDRR